MNPFLFYLHKRQHRLPDGVAAVGVSLFHSSRIDKTVVRDEDEVGQAFQDRHDSMNKFTFNIQVEGIDVQGGVVNLGVDKVEMEDLCLRASLEKTIEFPRMKTTLRPFQEGDAPVNFSLVRDTQEFTEV